MVACFYRSRVCRNRPRTVLVIRKDHIHSKQYTDEQTYRIRDRQTDRQTYRQTDRLTDRQTDRQTERQTGRHTDMQTHTVYY